MKQRKKQSIFRTRLFLLSCSIVVSLFLGEYILVPVLCRLLDKPGLSLFSFQAHPNTQVEDTPINSQGFTGHVLKPSRPEPNIVRILTLGGSAMFNRRMTERLIENLSKVTSARLEIQGGALRTHSSRSSVIKYKEHFYKYSFDYVLICHAINDLYMNHVALEDFEADYSHYLPWHKRNAVLNHSVIARVIYNRIFWHPPKHVENGSQFASCQTFEQNIRQLIRLIRSDNGFPILMTFAWYIPDDYTKTKLYQGRLDYDNSPGYNQVPVELWGSVDYVREGLTRHNSIIRKIAREERVMLIDIERIYTSLNDSRNFSDVCHFSEQGTEVFIKIITDRFISQGLLPGLGSTEIGANRMEALDDCSVVVP